MAKTGNKVLPKNLKIKRIQWQIDGLKERMKLDRDNASIKNMGRAVANRERAVEYLKQESSENLDWREIKKMFRFDYFAYYTNQGKLSTNTKHFKNVFDLLTFLDGRGIVYTDETLVRKALKEYGVRK